MTQLFSLYPLASVFLFLLPFKGKGRRGLLLAFLLSVGAVLWGWDMDLISVGWLYAVLFLSGGLFQFPLKQEVHMAVGRSLPKQLHFQEEIAKVEEECRQWEETKSKLGSEIDEITRRFSFAQRLVSQMEEEPMLNDLGLLFSGNGDILSVGFSTLKEESQGCFWNSIYSRGSKSLEEWNKILEKVPVNLNRSKDRFISPLSSHLLIGEPVRWEKKAQGLLTFLVKEPLPKTFLDQVKFYGQILGLGFHKISLYRQILERSRRDGLTQLYLRRVFLERLKEEMNFSKRYGTSFSLLMLDLDYFKSVNDTHGHLAGDEVLKSVAQTLRETLNPGVTICRYGGEEFSVLVGLAPREEVRKIAEEIRVALEQKTRVTASIGIAYYLPDAPAVEELIHRADSALYKAKSEGRNCVREWI